MKMKKKFVQFFKIRVLAKKKAPAGRLTAKTNKFLKNISKGDMKKGSAKGMKKKSLKVISGHDGHLLHPKGMADAPP